MRKLSISENELVHLFEMCLDAEERCEKRCHELRANGHHERAAYEAQLRDKYAYLKARIFEAMKSEAPASTLQEILRHLSSITRWPATSENDLSAQQTH